MVGNRRKKWEWKKGKRVSVGGLNVKITSLLGYKWHYRGWGLGVGILNQNTYVLKFFSRFFKHTQSQHNKISKIFKQSK